MIRVGFIGATDKWLGGRNYLRNLLFAISRIKDRKIQPVVFLGTKNVASSLDVYAPYAEIVQTPLLDRYSLAWGSWKVASLFWNRARSIEPFLSKQGIQVLSHSDMFGFRRIKTINWIPDFQHKHLPTMFDEKEIRSRDSRFQDLLEKSDRVVLSSHDVLKDVKEFYPKALSKCVVIQFVAQPDRVLSRIQEDDVQQVRQKYGLPQRFFYLPNQFWKHKNHMVVFEAVRLLKDEGVDVHLACSGPMEDYRHPEHITDLKKLISDHHLDKNISLLGMIAFEDVMRLFMASQAVINPSLFEGWSTTVEECKSMGKRVILSNIPVHQEQAPYGGIYFDPHDPADLADKLKKNWLTKEQSPFLRSAEDLQNDLNERTRIFGEDLQRLIMEIAK